MVDNFDKVFLFDILLYFFGVIIESTIEKLTLSSP